MKFFALLTLAAMPLAACASHAPTTASPSAAAAGTPSVADQLANGRSIFLRGRDTDGIAIHAQPPALHPSCAACHRENGAGGVHLPGGAVSADLRRSALVAGQRHPYTIALLGRAISTGIDNDGEPLNRVMPRWRLSERDLHDVAFYVLNQLK
ncbi:MAG: c-type cytochrome [Candidatus Tyrphobacter sp.]